MNVLRSTRRRCYALARVLGDLSALLSGSPKKLLKRGANKLIGRNVVRRFFLR